MKKIYTLLLIIIASITSYAQIIYIDPGHGYGATVSDNPDGRTATEVETNLAVGLKLKTLLTDNCSSVIVHMSRTTNVNGWSNVSNRALQAQNWNADRLISIHCNADGDATNDASATSTATGTETYYSTAVKTTANTESASVHLAYANIMNAELALKGSMAKRNSGNPYLRDNLGIFGRSTTACLNEIGFVDNSNDKAKLLSDTWRDQFALGYYTGLKSNLNITCNGTVAAPGTFTLTVTPECNGTTSRMVLSWTASANATSYDVYKDGALWDSNITTTTYTNTNGVVAGSTHTYSIKAKNSGTTQTINSNGTLSLVALNCVVPGAFTLTVTPECSTSATPRNKLTWTASTNATAYNIYRNGVLYASNITNTTYTNTAVTSGTSYSYYVVAKNTTTIQTTNSNGNQTVIALNCAIPESFTLTATPECNGTSSQVALSWTASVNATAYDLYRNSVLYATDLTGTSYTNTAVTANTNYTYSIKAKNTTTTQTTNSNGTLSITTLDCNPIPGAFTLTVTPECSGTGNPRNKLSWTTSANATAYNIYRNGILYASSVTGTTYTNTAVTTGTSYTYYVKAKNATTTQTTNSNGSQTVVALNCAAPGSFTITTTPECNNGSSRINLSWTTSANATSYDIYRNGNLYATDVTGNQFLNTYITEGSTYTYSLVAKNNIGTLANSNGTLSTTATSCPPGTFTVTATPTCSSTTSAINLTWTAATNATSYDIYRNGNLYASDIIGTTFLNTYLITAGTTYTYYVKAKNGNGTINNSNGTLSVIAINCTSAKITEDTKDFEEIVTLSFYPNPTEGILNLKINKTNIQNIHFMIMDSNGRIIKEDYLGESRIIDISELPASAYFIRTVIDGEEFVKQIIKK